MEFVAGSVPAVELVAGSVPEVELVAGRVPAVELVAGSAPAVELNALSSTNLLLRCFRERWGVPFPAGRPARTTRGAMARAIESAEKNNMVLPERRKKT